MSARTSTRKPAAAPAVEVVETPTGDVQVKAALAPQTCRCGCGQQVAARRLYRPGHDARHAGAAARAARAGDPTAIPTLPTPALQAKATALAAKWQAEAEAKAARLQARADAAQAAAQAVKA